MNWKNESGDWTVFRQLPGLEEIDFHWGDRDDGGAYWEHMAEVESTALAALKEAHETGTRYVLFTHGASTSEGWKQTTARSVVRSLMRSPAATPYVVRRECIQHRSVFLAAIRPKNQAAREAVEGKGARR